MATLDADGQAKLTTTSLDVGTQSIAAFYASQGNFKASTSAKKTATVAVAPLVVRDVSAGSPASGINDAAIASLLADWSQDDWDVSDSLMSVLSA
jgi:hypothetical protein